MKRQSEPKLTQQQIIDRLIDSTAYILATHYPHTQTEFITAKNQPTLASMVKRGIVQWAEFSTNTVVFTAKSIAQYEAQIRAKAVEIAARTFNDYAAYLRSELQRHHDQTYLKWCKPQNVKFEHWNHGAGSDFDFIEWRVTDESQNWFEHRIMFHYQHETALHQISEVFAAAEEMTRAEIAKIPLVEMCAIR